MTTRPQLSPRFAKLILNFVPGSIVPAAVSVIGTSLFTRAMSPGAYGSYAIAMAALLVLSSVGTQWLNQSINRFLPGVEADGLERVRLAIGLSIVSCTGLVALLFGFVRLVGGSLEFQADTGISIVFTLSLIAIVAFLPLCAFLQARLDSTTYSLFQMADSFGRVGIGLLLITSFVASPSMLLLAIAITDIVLAIALWNVVKIPGVVRIWMRRGEAFQTVKSFLSYGLPMMGWFLCASLLTVSDRFLIQYFGGSGEVGIYSANFNLINGGVALLASPAILAAHPFLMKTWKENKLHETSAWLGMMGEWMVVAGVTLTSGIALYAYEISTLFLGSEFREGWRCLAPIGAGAAIWQFGFYAHKPLEFEKQTRLMLFLSSLAVMVNLVLNILMIPSMGYVGAAYARVFAYASYVIPCWVLGRKRLPWRMDRMRVLRGSMAVVLSSFAAYAIGELALQKCGRACSLGVRSSILIAGLVWVTFAFVIPIRHHYSRLISEDHWV
jgi:O-antigen/teichoic acid export membrane protein